MAETKKPAAKSAASTAKKTAAPKAAAETTNKTVKESSHMMEALGMVETRGLVAAIEAADAMAKAETPEQKDRLFITNLSWRYLKQCVTYDSLYTKGTDEQKSAYMVESQKIYDEVMSRNIVFSEHGDPNFNIYISPANWA